MTKSYENQRDNPCYGCPDRYTACSDHCEKPEFLAWKAEREKIRENRKKYQAPIWMRREGYVRKL